MKIKLSKKLKNDLIYYCIRILVPVARRLPRGLGLQLFTLVGHVLWLLSSTERQRTLDNLTLIFGTQWSEQQIRATARGVFHELGKNIFDALYLSRCPQKVFDSIVVHNDLAPVFAAYAKGKGVVAITAHVGCFEHLLHLFGRRGLKSFAIGQRVYDPRLEKYAASLRSGPNIAYMNRNGSSREIFRHLQAGEVFGVLIDQDTKVEGVFAPFLGRPAHTPSAPMRLAMRYDLPVFVATTARQPDNRHRMQIHGPLTLVHTGNFEADLVHNITLANDIISTAILQTPRQWVWMHRRWLKKP
jgi:KDO2-lipid IV(A) lauroyltransferase